MNTVRLHRILSLIIILLTAISSAAKNSSDIINESDFEKLICQYDVADTVMNVPDAASFWKTLRATNRTYYKTAKSLAGNGNSDIKRNIIIQLSECDNYFTNVTTAPHLYKLSESITDASGIRALNPTAILTVTADNSIAIFGYPNGYIYMTDGLYEAIERDSITIQALFIKECAHYALQHAYAHSLWEKKRHNRRKVWGTIGGSVLSALGLIIQSNTDSYMSPAGLGMEIGGGILIASSSVGPKYKMTYTPGQIIEADIISYRFMEWSGNGGESYINALRRIGNDIDATTPQVEGLSVPTRIALLEYLAAHPEIRPKVKANKQKPKQPPYIEDKFAPSNYK